MIITQSNHPCSILHFPDGTTKKEYPNGYIVIIDSKTKEIIKEYNQLPLFNKQP